MDPSCPECGSKLPESTSVCPACEAQLSAQDVTEEEGLAAPDEAWLTVCAGSMSEIVALRAIFEDAGIPTFVPDSMMKVIDPFITGGNIFEVRLQVPAGNHGQAAELLAQLKESAATRRASEEAAEEEVEESPEEPDSSSDDIEKLGRRVRWAAVMFITAPVGVVWGLRYLAEARNRDPKPISHALTVAAFWLSLLDVLLIAYVLGVSL